MLYIVIILFALAAVMGVLILKNILAANHAPRAVVYTHGIFAAVALVLLVVYAVQNGTNGVMASIVLFIIAALGGFYMFFRDLKGKLGPVWLAIVHALLAVTGFVILLLFIL